MNAMKYYVDTSGAYLGGWDADPPKGTIEVPTAPLDARQVWDFANETWGAIPPLTEYILPAVTPWLRMTEEEAELVQDGVDSAPVRTRQLISKATSFTTGTDAFTKFKGVISDALSPARAQEIMGPPQPYEALQSAPAAT